MSYGGMELLEANDYTTLADSGICSGSEINIIDDSLGVICISKNYLNEKKSEAHILSD